MSSKALRTYGSKSNKQPLPSSPSSASSPVSMVKRRRPLHDYMSSTNLPPKKRVKPSDKPVTQKKALTQLHFCLDTSILRTCPLCDLSYTKGALDDEHLHRAHCARVQRGMEWGKDEVKEKIKAGVIEVATGVKLKDGRKGRIISFRADVGGKIGSKLATLLETINLSLSSPPLMPSILQASKAYLFLLPTTSSSSREKIVGCVIAQRISKAMAIANPPKCTSTSKKENATANCPSTSPHSPATPTAALIAVDTSTGLFCHPELLPTPLGIPRLFVVSTHRRQGIASRLLSAAADTFIHGCPVDPVKGEVAFTQPTGAGHAIMQVWGKAGARIYEE